MEGAPEPEPVKLAFVALSVEGHVEAERGAHAVCPTREVQLQSGADEGQYSECCHKIRIRTIARLKLLVSMGSWALYAGAKERFGWERPVSAGDASPIELGGGGGGVLPISAVPRCGLPGSGPTPGCAWPLPLLLLLGPAVAEDGGSATLAPWVGVPGPADGVGSSRQRCAMSRLTHRPQGLPASHDM